MHNTGNIIFIVILTELRTKNVSNGGQESIKNNLFNSFLYKILLNKH